MFPIAPPVKPMLAKALSGEEIPRDGKFLFEPKWDGFRCIVFRDGDSVELGSRNERPLTRYFPELVEKLKQALPDRVVLDGEIVMVVDDRLDFGQLQNRLHPAASRVEMLSESFPASFVAFDVLALDNRDLRSEAMIERRKVLEAIGSHETLDFFVTPVTEDPDVAAGWFNVMEGAGLDGLIAKPHHLTYQENKRVMFKIKHQRTADCVVGGYRIHKDGKGVGSLLLGLYDESGTLNHVGVASSFSAKRRTELLDELKPYVLAESDQHPWAQWALVSEGARRMPGSQSRWSVGKDISFEPLRIELVAEVAYDYMEGDRFRHATRLVRWREDRDPNSCRFDQLEEVDPSTFSEIFNQSS